MMRLNLFYFLMGNAILLMELVFLLVMFLAMIRLVFAPEKRLKASTQRGVFICLTMVLLLLCTSCKSNSIPDDPFFQLYDPLHSSLPVVSRNGSSVENPVFSFSASACPFPLVSRLISDKFNIGIVFAENLNQKKITAEFKNSSLSDCLDVISRQVSSHVVKVGSTYFIGELRAHDRAILVRRVFGFSNDDLTKAVQSVLSSSGKSTTISTGLITATDDSSVLARVSELLDYLSESDFSVWIVQLAFLTINRDILIEGGLKVSTSGTISYNVSDSEFKLQDINLDGIVNAAMSSSFADVHSLPMLLVREGSISQWKQGKRVPVPKRSVSDQGTVVITGFDYIDVGFNVKVLLNRSRAGALVDLEIGNSSIDSYVETSPVTSQNTYHLLCDMVPLRPYLLGEISTFKDLNTQSDILNLGKTKGKSSVQVWGQVYPIRPSGVRRRFPLSSSGAKVRD